MESNDLLKKVRKIEIKTRGLTNQIFAGEYHSAYKGRGMAFSEVRAYQYGDDIRNIDWNVTARFRSPYIKVFEEERELTVMLLIDVSGSGNTGSRMRLKRTLMAEVAAVLSFSAIQNNDKVGVIFFSDQVEKFIPPKKGRQHILRVISEVIHFEPEHNKTDLRVALQYLTNAIKKKSTAFILSDFIAPDFEQSLRIAGRKHDIAALRVYDSSESGLPSVGLMKIRDAETDKVRWVDTSSSHVRREYAKWWNNRQNRLNEIFMRCGTDFCMLRTDHDYVKSLITLFKRRAL